MFLVNCKLVVMFLRSLLCLVALCCVLLWGMAVRNARHGGVRALCFSIACFQPRQTFRCITEMSKLQKCKRIWIHLSDTQQKRSQRHSFWWKEEKHADRFLQVLWWYSATIYWNSCSALARSGLIATNLGLAPLNEILAMSIREKLQNWSEVSI